MKEPVCTVHPIADEFEAGRFVMTAIFNGDQESNALKIDLSKLEFADPKANEPTCTVESLKWHIAGKGTLNIDLAGEPSVRVAELCGCGEIDGGKLADAGGNLSVSTVNFGTADAYVVEVIIRKRTGFGLMPATENDVCNQE